jgi:hypothetical protein
VESEINAALMHSEVTANLPCQQLVQDPTIFKILQFPIKPQKMPLLLRGVLD